MLDYNRTTAIILAGGESCRMGYDKGFAKFKGAYFIEHILEALPELNEVLIVSNNKSYEQFNLKRVQDLHENIGPLAGVYAGLYHSTTEYNLILSCDLPFLKKELIEMLFKEVTDAFDIVQVAVQNKTNPLLAVYKKKCMLSCKKALENGERRLCEFVNRQKTKTIALNYSLANYAKNVNSKADLETKKQ